ncbi:hypothetical protein ABOUO_82 [Brevibacillus phage Abouo]|uniref:Uncharacterized protein n=2 Tax=root TaxID=1 RepID=S5MP11_9CAUD|nr:hypothetical protein AVV45_gp82 [Brevibacillus phage Abouo]AGR47510.1 hypothetical protein ABOUO_82 [Brevibacillus phage Abouo]
MYSRSFVTKIGGQQMERIYCTYADTEVASLYTHVQCPYCNHEQNELDMDECGKIYVIECEECEEQYEMYFDAS